MDPDHARELLARERAQVERQLADLTPSPAVDENSDIDTHMADEGSQLYDAEFDAGEAEHLRDKLAAIERAERRLEEGTYGVSVESGQPIPDARLEAIPWAERTVEEQARFGG
jgi:DnaK suppressor protein